jgi:hypothetical protein
VSTGMKFAKFAGIAVLCLGSLSVLHADTAHNQHKTKKPQLPPLPSGPQGPVPQIPLDSIAPVPPQVSFQNGKLSIVAPNSTLGDILRAVRKQTGAEIEIPAANERVVTNLGPGPVREVMADLLNGSRFNYVLLGSAEDSSLLTRVVLVAKTGPQGGGANNAPIAQPQPGPMQAGNVPPQPPEQDASADPAEADASDDSAEENPDQSAAEAEQAEPPAAAAPDQSTVKTPQQLLQEMQQRQLQQQQPPGQAPIPSPVRPPQEQ